MSNDSKEAMGVLIASAIATIIFISIIVFAAYETNAVFAKYPPVTYNVSNTPHK